MVQTDKYDPANPPVYTTKIFRVEVTSDQFGPDTDRTIEYIHDSLVWVEGVDSVIIQETVA
jgi:hypothetical protein